MTSKTWPTSPACPFTNFNYGAGFVNRSNLTQSTSPDSARWFWYDIAGNALSAADGQGHSVSTTYSAATQYAAPDNIAPGGNDDFSTDYTYSSFLGLSTIDTVDSGASVSYDSFARPAQSTSPYGATTYFTYDSNNVRLVTATTGTRIVKTTLDGLGRTIKVETGDSNGTKSVVETQYDSCACSPLGKVKQVSRPYKPGDPVYWTVYGYDALGQCTLSPHTTRLPGVLCERATRRRGTAGLAVGCGGDFSQQALIPGPLAGRSGRIAAGGAAS